MTERERVDAVLDELIRAYAMIDLLADALAELGVLTPREEAEA